MNGGKRFYTTSCIFQPEIDAEVKVLLQLKAEYKSVTGSDWKPPSAAGATPKKQDPEPVQATSMADSPAATELKGKIDKQGGIVRELKEAKGAKVCPFYHVTITQYIYLIGACPVQSL